MSAAARGLRQPTLEGRTALERDNTDDLAGQTACQQIAHVRAGRVEPETVTGHHDDVSLVRRRGDSFGLEAASRQRLLHKHVQTGLNARDGRIRQRIVRNGNHGRIGNTACGHGLDIVECLDPAMRDLPHRRLGPNPRLP